MVITQHTIHGKYWRDKILVNVATFPKPLVVMNWQITCCLHNRFFQGCHTNIIRKWHLIWKVDLVSRYPWDTCFSVWFMETMFIKNRHYHAYCMNPVALQAEALILDGEKKSWKIFQLDKPSDHFHHSSY